MFFFHYVEHLILNWVISWSERNPQRLRLFDKINKVHFPNDRLMPHNTPLSSRGGGWWSFCELTSPQGTFDEPAIFYFYVVFSCFEWALFWFWHSISAGPSGLLEDLGCIVSCCHPARTLCSPRNNRACPLTLLSPARPSAPPTHSSGFPHLQPVSYTK